MSTKSELRRSKRASARNKSEAEERAFWKSVTSRPKAVNLLEDLENEVDEMLKLKQQMEIDYSGVEELSGALHTLNHSLKMKLRRIAKLEVAIIENQQSSSGRWIKP